MSAKGWSLEVHKYELVLEESPGHPELQIELIANDPSAAFSWAERHAHGRRFEIFEDGKSLGRVALAEGANFWILSPAAGRLAPVRPTVPEPPARALALSE